MVSRSSKANINAISGLEATLKIHSSNALSYSSYFPYRDPYRVSRRLSKAWIEGVDSEFFDASQPRRIPSLCLFTY